METPSSTRMVTRSQISKNSVSTSSSKDSRQRKTGQALVDITNDSPIVGLTSGCLKTPLTSSARKGRGSKRSKVTLSPGSGEALLRGQVKNLLEMVEEETELQKQQLPCRPFLGIYRALADSPVTLLAPANTPQVLSSGDQELPSPIVQDPIFTSQAVNGVSDDGRKVESFESKNALTRSLMVEFLEKEDDSECRLTVTDLEVVESGQSNGKSVVVGDDDVDDSSTWSMQVNVSTHDDDEDVGDEVVYQDEHVECECAEYDNADELCSGISSLSVSGETKLPVFTGKHIRFVYNSDEEEEEEDNCTRKQ